MLWPKKVTIFLRLRGSDVEICVILGQFCECIKVPERKTSCRKDVRATYDYGWPDVQLIENLGFSTHILDYRSKIQDFQLIIQDFQKQLGLSVDNPRFSSIIQVFDLIIQVFRIFGHLASKILDFQSIIQVFQLEFDNLGLSIRKTWIITLINQDFRFIVHYTLKILDFQSIIQVIQLTFENLGFSNYWASGVENPRFSIDNPSLST